MCHVDSSIPLLYPSHGLPHHSNISKLDGCPSLLQKRMESLHQHCMSFQGIYHCSKDEAILLEVGGFL
jgi:hypothetical protein